MYVVSESIELFTNAPCLFFCSLTFLDFTYGVLYSSVAFFQQFFSLFPCPSQNFTAAFLQFLDVCLILGNCLFEGFLALMYVLALAFPVAFVADNVLKILVALYVVADALFS